MLVEFSFLHGLVLYIHDFFNYYTANAQMIFREFSENSKIESIKSTPCNLLSNITIIQITIESTIYNVNNQFMDLRQELWFHCAQMKVHKWNNSNNHFFDRKQ